MPHRQDGGAREGLVTGKGDKERVVFFAEEALTAIRAYLEARADARLPLFLRHDDGRGKPGLGGLIRGLEQLREPDGSRPRTAR